MSDYDLYAERHHDKLTLSSLEYDSSEMCYERRGLSISYLLGSYRLLTSFLQYLASIELQ